MSKERDDIKARVTESLYLIDVHNATAIAYYEAGDVERTLRTLGEIKEALAEATRDLTLLITK